MYDALLALQRALSRPRAPDADLRQISAQQLPPGLPEAVQRSIQLQPSYGEEQVIPTPGPKAYEYESFAPDTRLQRETDRYGLGERERLKPELEFKRFAVPQLEYAAPEGAIARPLTNPYTGQPFGSPYGRPYNLGLGNLGALY